MQISTTTFCSLTSMTDATFWMGSKVPYIFRLCMLLNKLFIIIFDIYLCSESHHNSISQAFTKCNNLFFCSSLCTESHHNSISQAFTKCNNLFFCSSLCSESHHNSISQAFTECNNLFFYSSVCSESHHNSISQAFTEWNSLQSHKSISLGRESALGTELFWEHSVPWPLCTRNQVSLSLSLSLSLQMELDNTGLIYELHIWVGRRGRHKIPIHLPKWSS
jgi:hypothetical protein